MFTTLPVVVNARRVELLHDVLWRVVLMSFTLGIEQVHLRHRNRGREPEPLLKVGHCLVVAGRVEPRLKNVGVEHEDEAHGRFGAAIRVLLEHLVPSQRKEVLLVVAPANRQLRDFDRRAIDSAATIGYPGSGPPMLNCPRESLVVRAKATAMRGYESFFPP